MKIHKIPKIKELLSEKARKEAEYAIFVMGNEQKVKEMSKQYVCLK